MLPKLIFLSKFFVFYFFVCSTYDKHNLEMDALSTSFYENSAMSIWNFSGEKNFVEIGVNWPPEWTYECKITPTHISIAGTALLRCCPNPQIMKCVQYVYDVECQIRCMTHHTAHLLCLCFAIYWGFHVERFSPLVKRNNNNNWMTLCVMLLTGAQCRNSFFLGFKALSSRSCTQGLPVRNNEKIVPVAFFRPFFWLSKQT